MKIMTFPEINDLENGQQIPSFQGTIKKVLEPKTGVGDYGPWSLQTLFLTDEHENEIKVTWTVADAWDASTEGKTFLFESGHDKKDQLVGLKKEIRKKDGKVYESVKVDDRAKVKVLSGGVPDEGNPEIREPHRTPPSQSDWPEAPVTAPELPLPRDNGNGGVVEARKHLMKACNLYNLCIKAVDAAIAPNMPEIARTSEQFQATLESLWIEASSRRSDDGIKWWSYIDGMPEKPI